MMRLAGEMKAVQLLEACVIRKLFASLCETTQGLSVFSGNVRCAPLSDRITEVKPS